MALRPPLGFPAKAGIRAMLPEAHFRRSRLCSWFTNYNNLANGVRQFLEVELPEMDLSNLNEVANERPRQVTPPS